MGCKLCRYWSSKRTLQHSWSRHIPRRVIALCHPRRPGISKSHWDVAEPWVWHQWTVVLTTGTSSSTSSSPHLRCEALSWLHKKTPFNTFAYHYRGATPLMFGIILGKYSIAGFLLEAKARIDICNSRKQTAFDLAVKQSAPDALLWNLWKRGAGSYASQASVSWWCAHTVSLTVQPKGEGILEDDMDDLDPLDPLDPMISIIFWFLPADFPWNFRSGGLAMAGSNDFSFRGWPKPRDLLKVCNGLVSALEKVE